MQATTANALPSNAPNKDHRTRSNTKPAACDLTISLRTIMTQPVCVSVPAGVAAARKKVAPMRLCMGRVLTLPQRTVEADSEESASPNRSFIDQGRQKESAQPIGKGLRPSHRIRAKVRPSESRPASFPYKTRHESRRSHSPTTTSSRHPEPSALHHRDRPSPRRRC